MDGYVGYHAALRRTYTRFIKDHVKQCKQLVRHHLDSVTSPYSLVCYESDLLGSLGPSTNSTYRYNHTSAGSFGLELSDRAVVVHNDISNEIPLTVLDEKRGFENNYLSDIPEMMNSGDGKLSFLAEDENTPDKLHFLHRSCPSWQRMRTPRLVGSQGGTPDFTKNQSGESEVDMLSVRSRAVAKFLKSRLSVTPISGRQSEDLSLNKILEGKRRKVSARMVFETLSKPRDKSITPNDTFVLGKRKERSGEEFDEREVVDKNLNPLTPSSSDFSDSNLVGDVDVENEGGVVGNEGNDDKLLAQTGKGGALYGELLIEIGSVGIVKGGDTDCEVKVDDQVFEKDDSGVGVKNGVLLLRLQGMIVSFWGWGNDCEVKVEDHVWLKDESGMGVDNGEVDVSDEGNEHDYMVEEDDCGMLVMKENDIALHGELLAESESIDMGLVAGIGVDEVEFGESKEMGIKSEETLKKELADFKIKVSNGQAAGILLGHEYNGKCEEVSTDIEDLQRIRNKASTDVTNASTDNIHQRINASTDNIHQRISASTDKDFN
ncbi:hypothetical protein AgCh_010458 [Apium graveolens]